jgi:hypothetical protein
LIRADSGYFFKPDNPESTGYLQLANVKSDFSSHSQDIFGAGGFSDSLDNG